MTPIRAPVPDALPIDLPSSANEQISPVPISPPSSKTNEMFCFTPRPTILFFSITVPDGNRVPGKIKEPSPRLHWAPMILPAPTVTFIPATVFSQITELFILLPSPIFTPLYNILARYRSAIGYGTDSRFGKNILSVRIIHVFTVIIRNRTNITPV